MQKKLTMAAVIHRPKALFLDEPSEGVDAIAAGMPQNMLTGMINRGATIFLTTRSITERFPRLQKNSTCSGDEHTL